MKKKALSIAVLFAVLPVFAQTKTPPMGWNSWNRFHGNISEALIKEIADGAKKHKLAEAGYKYLVIDDCWQAKELGGKGELLPDPKKFPNGIPALVKHVRSRGFELGIYSSPNKRTCADYPGSLGREVLHARQFSDWGVKYVKYDYCPTRNKEQHLEREKIIERYRCFNEALKRGNPDIVHAICEKGWAGGVSRYHPDNKKRMWDLKKSLSKEEKKNPPRLFSKKEMVEAFSWSADYGVMWRTSGDISAKWDRIMHILDMQEGLEVLCGPGAFNDPDMLEVGNGKLTASENRAHFSLWCMLTAPLILGSDLRDIPDEVLEIITHKEMIAINQDRLCKQAVKVLDTGDLEIFTKPLSNGDLAVCVLNRGESAVEADVKWSDLGLEKGTEKRVRDIWAGKDFGKYKDRIKSSVASHDVVVYRLSL
ncbi:MAG: glycoside hydrolase family 27 protein [Kiritimatiellales bacterium]|nr:glycoside hydrolase family 27 protein [Kiritimatiellales bacterium]